MAVHRNSSQRIELMPVEGKMMVNALVPQLDRQVFGLGVPETIGCQEQMWLVNHADVEIDWQLEKRDGSVSARWAQDGLLHYDLRLVPGHDYVDIELVVYNQSDAAWSDVFAFNCVSPAKAPDFRDPDLRRTYLSVAGEPVAVAQMPRVQGPRPSIGVYAHRDYSQCLPPFAQVFEATSPVPSDGTWMAIVAASGDAYMATAAPASSFMFNNTDFGCIHAALLLGAIAPQTQVGGHGRVYFAGGGLDDFLGRHAAGTAAEA
ncbi:MAG: hypothetical protein GKR89_11765 [Candidatus Latescibacteria bacterium]|nr:hypothetical protein [Candidatus Latescibacterota bacterium]